MSIKATISEIQGVVATAHGLTREHMRCESRARRFAVARQEAYYLARELTSHSLPSIGNQFGRRDHTTILYGIRKIAARVATDEKLAARLDACRQKIAELVAERAKALGLTVGASTEWSPPPPMRLAKPDRVYVSFGERAYVRRDGELERAA